MAKESIINDHGSESVNLARAKQLLQGLKNSMNRTVQLESIPQDWTDLLAYSVEDPLDNTKTVTKMFNIGDSVIVEDTENGDEEYEHLVVYTLVKKYKEGNVDKALWMPGGAGGAGGSATGKIKVNLEAYVNAAKTAGTDLAGLEVTLTNTTDNVVVATKEWAGETLVFAKVTPLKNYSISVEALEGYTAPVAQSITNLGIGEEVTKTFQYEADGYQVSITSNQGTDDSISGAWLRASFEYGGKPYTKQASTGIVKVPAGVTPTIAASSNVAGYSKVASVDNVNKILSVVYSTTKVFLTDASNQNNDSVLSGLSFAINGTAITENDNTSFVKVPTGDSITITAPDITGYRKTITGGGAASGTSQTVHVQYDTTLVGVNMVGSSNNVEGEAPSGAGATVKYTGGTDQTVNNSTTAKVPTGTDFTIEYNTVSNYSTPETYSGTASGTSMTATKAVYIYGVLKVEVTVSDNDNTDLEKVTAQVAVNGGSATTMTGTVDTTTHKKIFSVSLDPGASYVISFGNVEGYATPANISGTKGNGVETKVAEYETDIYTLNVNGQSKTEQITYTGLASPVTLSSGNAVKVPTGLTPSVVSDYVKGYSRTVNVGSVTSHAATISVSYSTTPVAVAIQSNQTSDAVIGALRATVSWSYDGHNESETLTTASGSVNVPTGVTPTITFPNAPTGYSRSISGDGLTATYSTTILTVTVTSDTGEADLSGVTLTVTDTTESQVLTAQQDGTYLIPTGHGYSVTASDDVEGYSAPDVATGTASGTSASATMTYEEAAGFVDLGLSVKWAQANIVKDGNKYKIGDNETDYGCYFSWGNIVGHESANGSTFDDGYDFGSSNSGPYASTPGKNVTANIASNDAQHDAALACLGAPWRLPTKEEFKELYDNTDREWTTINGVSGWKFMKKTDHSVYVFFPAAGDGDGTSLNGRGSYGYYWSSSWYSSDYAYYMYFGSSSVNPQSNYYRRYLGFSVRAVQ